MCKRPLSRITKSSNAFTRLDLLGSVVAFALLSAAITPALGTSRSRSDRVACLSNLRQIGTALRHFALDNNDFLPWRPQAPQSNFNDPRKHDLWFQYWWLRGAIGSPRVLIDPADTRPSARIATNWNFDVDGGLQFLRNNAVSYVLGLDSSTDLPRSMLVSDRNIVTSGYGGCSSQLSAAAIVSPTTARWFDDVHGLFGNVALADGSVDSIDSAGLRRVIGESRDAGSVHIMMPQF